MRPRKSAPPLIGPTGRRLYVRPAREKAVVLPPEPVVDPWPARVKVTRAKAYPPIAADYVDVDLQATRLISVLAQLVEWLRDVGRLVTYREMFHHVRDHCNGFTLSAAAVDGLVGMGFIVQVDNRYQLLGKQNHVIPLKDALPTIRSARYRLIVQTLVDLGGTAYTPVIARVLGLHPTTTMTALQALRRKGFVRRDGGLAKIRWRVCDPVVTPLNGAAFRKRSAYLPGYAHTDSVIHRALHAVYPSGACLEEVMDRTGYKKEVVARALARLIGQRLATVDGRIYTSLRVPSEPRAVDMRWMVLADALYDDAQGITVAALSRRTGMVAPVVSAVMAEQQALGNVEVVGTQRGWQIVEERRMQIREEIRAFKSRKVDWG